MLLSLGVKRAAEGVSVFLILLLNDPDLGFTGRELLTIVLTGQQESPRLHERGVHGEHVVIEESGHQTPEQWSQPVYLIQQHDGYKIRRNSYVNPETMVW